MHLRMEFDSGVDPTCFNFVFWKIVTWNLRICVAYKSFLHTRIPYTSTMLPLRLTVCVFLLFIIGIEAVYKPYCPYYPYCGPYRGRDNIYIYKALVS